MKIQLGNRDGFSLVEVMIAMVILTVGLLGMAATTATVTTQVRIANLRTERMAAVQHTVEHLRGVPFGDVVSTCGSIQQRVGSYDIACASSGVTSNLIQVDVVTQGPGYQPGTGWQSAVSDTFRVNIARR